MTLMVRRTAILCGSAMALISLIYFAGDGKSGPLDKHAIRMLLIKKDPHFRGNFSLAELGEWAAQKGEMRVVVWVKSISFEHVEQDSPSISYLTEPADIRKKPIPQTVRAVLPSSERPPKSLLLTLLEQPDDFWTKYLLVDESQPSDRFLERARWVKTRSELYGEWTPRGEPREKFHYRIIIRIRGAWGKEDKVSEWPQYQHLPESRRPSSYGESYINYLYFNKAEELPPVFRDWVKWMGEVYKKYARKNFFPEGFFASSAATEETTSKK